MIITGAAQKMRILAGDTVSEKMLTEILKYGDGMMQIKRTKLGETFAFAIYHQASANSKNVLERYRTLLGVNTRIFHERRDVNQFGGRCMTRYPDVQCSQCK